MAKLAVTFRASDYFALAVLAMVTVTAMVGASLVRGLMSLTFGLFLGLIGLDSLTGQARFTFGVPELLDGVDIVVVIVGLFAIGETLYIASRLKSCRPRHAAGAGQRGLRWLSRPDWSRSWRPWLRGTALGFPFGALPSGGAEIPTFLSYTLEKRRSKHKQEWGKGAIEGSRDRRRPTTPPSPGFWSRCSPWASRPRPRPPSCSPPSATSTPARPAAVREVRRSGLGADRLAVRRQRPAAGAEPAADPGLGEGTADPSAGALHRHPRLRHARRLRGLGQRRRGADRVRDRRRRLVHAAFDFPIAPVILGVILGPMMEIQFRRALLLSDNDLSIFVPGR